MESLVIKVGFCRVLEHLYGFYVIYLCIIAHEPPYQTYSSVGQAGFRHRFPRTNDRTKKFCSITSVVYKGVGGQVGGGERVGGFSDHKAACSIVDRKMIFTFGK